MLNDSKLRTLKPRDKPYSVSDRLRNGLSVEVLPTGAICWRFRYVVAGRAEKISLGKYPDVSVKLAREKRDEAAKLVAEGKSPSAERQRQAADRRAEQEGRSGKTPVRDYLQEWFDTELSKTRKRPEKLQGWLDLYVFPSIGNLPIAEVKPDHIRALLFSVRDERQAPSSAHHIRGLLRQAFDFALHRGMIETNPVLAVPAKAVYRQKSRDRSLSPEEIRVFLNALDDGRLNPALSAAFKLLLLTLCRKGELLRARWEHVDLDAGTWVVPAANSKTNKPHVVYLPHQAIAIFEEILQPLAGESELVFPHRDSDRQPMDETSLNKALTRLALDMAKFTIHDLRRTGATLLAEMSFPSDVVEKALNHVLPGIRGVYNKAEHADARRQMLQHWADYLDALTAGAKVIPLHKKRA